MRVLLVVANIVIFLSSLVLFFMAYLRFKAVILYTKPSRIVYRDLGRIPIQHIPSRVHSSVAHDELNGVRQTGRTFRMLVAALVETHKGRTGQTVVIVHVHNPSYLNRMLSGLIENGIQKLQRKGSRKYEFTNGTFLEFVNIDELPRYAMGRKDDTIYLFDHTCFGEKINQFTVLKKSTWFANKEKS